MALKSLTDYSSLLIQLALATNILNIKHRETELAIHTLAGQLGTSLTAAVRQAVEHELQRLANDQMMYLEQLRQAAIRVRAISDPQTWLCETDLYDDTGQPR